MGTEVIDMGKISSRGQVAIPSEIRERMGLHEGEKVLFVLTDDTLVMKKITMKSFNEITRPLKQKISALKVKESDVPDIIHNFRKKK
ncbi:MAG: AbrB/MazE/SpoVT family DNA-binding domain-containing protein [Nanoarchaeota archaeon]|nr:AbrB/MazE/SpoVT family DNA-binding domain-containing protein [Nanoarchaeota archaeon]